MVGNDNDLTLCCCKRKMDEIARNVYKKVFRRISVKHFYFPKFKTELTCHSIVEFVSGKLLDISCYC